MFHLRARDAMGSVALAMPSIAVRRAPEMDGTLWHVSAEGI